MLVDVNLQEDFPILYDRYLGADSHICQYAPNFCAVEKANSYYKLFHVCVRVS